MRRVFQATLLTILLTFSAPSLGQASDTQGKYASFGRGNTRCLDYTVSLPARTAVPYEAWLAGYLTAFNRWHDGTFDIVGHAPPAQGFLWVMDYCRRHPLQTLDHAAEAMMLAFYPLRATRAPAGVLPPAPYAVQPGTPRSAVPPTTGQVSHASPASPASPVTPPSQTSPRGALIRHVQARLQAAGFRPGAIDGGFGPQTREALRGFQNAKGLRSTGEPDKPTLDALGIR